MKNEGMQNWCGSSSEFMKMHVLILVLILGSFGAFGQDSFNLRKDFFTCDWQTCDDDSTYANSDTVYLYTNFYTYHGQRWCNELTWVMDKKRVSFHRTVLCQEPPTSTVNSKWCFMKVKISKRKDVYEIQIGSGKNKHGRFEFVGSENVVLDNGEKSIRLTLLRIYENPVSL